LELSPALPDMGKLLNSNLMTNKKFLEELIAYFPFPVILVSDTSRKKTLVCMIMKSIKQYIWEAAVLVLLMGVTYDVYC
jgi:hypothetical protein